MLEYADAIVRLFEEGEFPADDSENEDAEAEVGTDEEEVLDDSVDPQFFDNANGNPVMMGSTPETDAKTEDESFEEEEEVMDIDVDSNNRNPEMMGSRPETVAKTEDETLKRKRK